MKTIYVILAPLVLLALYPLAACSGGDGDEMPRSIKKFLDDYFPREEVSAYTKSTAGHTVQLRKNATLVFNSSEEWTSIDGNGSTLPQQLIYDQCPDALFDYLEAMEENSGIYSLERTPTTYTVELLDAMLSFDIASGETVYI